MRPPEKEIRRLVAEWIKKADLDFGTGVRLSAEPECVLDALSNIELKVDHKAEIQGRSRNSHHRAFG